MTSAVAGLQLPLSVQAELLAAVAEGLVTSNDVAAVKQKLSQWLAHARKSLPAGGGGDQGSAALEARMRTVATALHCSPAAIMAAGVAMPALGGLNADQATARVAALKGLLGVAEAEAAQLAVQTPTLLVAPLPPLTAKLRVLGSTTGLPAAKASALITPYMFPELQQKS